MHGADSTAELVREIVALRRARAAIESTAERRRVARSIRRLRHRLGDAVPKGAAAAALSVTAQALDRSLADGPFPVVRRPGSRLELVDAATLLLLAAEVERLRRHGEVRVLAKAVASLENTGRMPRRLRPNRSARELRREFLALTPARTSHASRTRSRASARAGPSSSTRRSELSTRGLTPRTPTES